MDIHASKGHSAALGGNAKTLAGLAAMASAPMVLASKAGAVSGFGRLFRLNFLWTFPPRHWNNVKTADFPPKV